MEWFLDEEPIWQNIWSDLQGSLRTDGNCSFIQASLISRMVSSWILVVDDNFVEIHAGNAESSRDNENRMLQTHGWKQPQSHRWFQADGPWIKPEVQTNLTNCYARWLARNNRWLFEVVNWNRWRSLENVWFCAFQINNDHVIGNPPCRINLYSTYAKSSIKQIGNLTLLCYDGVINIHRCVHMLTWYAQCRITSKRFL